MCQLGAEEMIRTIRAIVAVPSFTSLSAENSIRQATDRLGLAGHNQIIEDAFDDFMEFTKKVKDNLENYERAQIAAAKPRPTAGFFDLAGI